MPKTELVRARIEPDTKIEAEKILRSAGLGHSAFISMNYYKMVETGKVPDHMLSQSNFSAPETTEAKNTISDVIQRADRVSSNSSAIERMIADLSGP